MEDKFLEAGRMIEKAQKILSISHKRPDGDTLGASNAIYWGLQQFGKQVDMACVDDIPERFQFLPDIHKAIKEFNFRDYDLIFVSDSGASYMTRYHEIYPDIFSGEVPVINLDHHASNDNFGTLNLVDVNSASTTILQYKMFTFLGIPITPNVATALMTGIYNDTGSLMHSNTTLEVYEIAGKLLEAGARLRDITKCMFKTIPLSTLKIWGRIMENAHVSDEGVTVSVVTWKDFQECEADTDEVSGAIDFLNAVPGSKYTCLLNEDKNGTIKGSFRTQRDDVDLSALAGQFGGGGHKKAAGFTVKGRMHRKIIWKITPDEAHVERPQALSDGQKSVNLPPQKPDFSFTSN